MSLFFFNDTATTEIYTLSLHDALPISTSNLKGFLARYVFNRSAGSVENPTKRTLSPNSVTTSLSLGRSIWQGAQLDRKSTRLNSSHSQISYAVFCLKKKK